MKNSVDNFDEKFKIAEKNFEIKKKAWKDKQAFNFSNLQGVKRIIEMKEDTINRFEIFSSLGKSMIKSPISLAIIIIAILIFIFPCGIIIAIFFYRVLLHKRVIKQPGFGPYSGTNAHLSPNPAFHNPPTQF